MKNLNITLDFTAKNAMESLTSKQELAIMPAELAKKLLKEYAKKLCQASAFEIIKPLLTAIEIAYTNNSVEDAINTCAHFIQERSLIDNCATGNWDAFNVKEVEMERQPLDHALTI